MKKQIITREFLEKTGITKITEDGRIFKGERELAQRKIVSKHKYGVDKVYLGVMLYDPECYQYQKAEHAKDPNKYKIPNVKAPNIIQPMKLKQSIKYSRR